MTPDRAAGEQETSPFSRFSSNLVEAAATTIRMAKNSRPTSAADAASILSSAKEHFSTPAGTPCCCKWCGERMQPLSFRH